MLPHNEYFCLFRANKSRKKNKSNMDVMGRINDDLDILTAVSRLLLTVWLE